MKFLAVLQIVCILFLSSFSGMARAGAETVKFDCCKKSNHADKCQHKSPEKAPCTNQGCTMLLSCGICAFLAIEPLTVKPSAFLIIEQAVTIYKIGNASGYYPSDWKPPKV